jgi:hypothetical protein
MSLSKGERHALRNFMVRHAHHVASPEEYAAKMDARLEAGHDPAIHLV